MEKRNETLDGNDAIDEIVKAVGQVSPLGGTLIRNEIANLRAEIAHLTSALATAETKIAALQLDRNEWRIKAEKAQSAASAHYCDRDLEDRD